MSEIFNINQQTMIDNRELESMVKKIKFLQESQDALLSIQDKLDRLRYFQSKRLLTYDLDFILSTWLVRLRELVKIEVCSVFLVEGEGIDFTHKISKPEKLALIVQKEIEAQIGLGNFGRAIVNDIPLSVNAEVFGKGSSRSKFSVMIAPLNNVEKTIGSLVMIFEQDKDFIRQQTMSLLHILVKFFSVCLENAFLFTDLKSMYFSTIKAIANSIEARDPYTRGHSERVAGIAKVIAVELGWEGKRVELIDWGGVLHDVGKIGIPDSILNKPAKLNDEEFRYIRMHPLIGSQIIQDISFLDEVIPYVLDHHERFDGKGYSNGLAGKDISIEGRLLAVADTFDAITSDRPYRNGLSYEYAREEILKNRGKQFDPEVVDAFESAWSGGRIKTYGGEEGIDICQSW